MNYSAIFHAFSFVVVGLSCAALVPLASALYFGEAPQVTAFIFVFVAGIMIGGAGAGLTSITYKQRKTGTSELLAFALLCWVSAPVLCAIPFVLGVANPSIYLAVQESTSCLTTTGYSVVEIGRDGWPVSLIVWRGVLHFIGAIWTMVMLVFVLSQLNISHSSAYKTSYLKIKSGDVFASLLNSTIQISKLLIVFGGIVFFALLMLGIGIVEAFLDMVSIVSTGNAYPVQPDFTNQFARQAFGSLGLLVSTAGFWFLYFARSGEWQEIPKRLDVLTFAFLVIVFAVFANSTGLDLWHSGLWSISALSTSGLYAPVFVNGYAGLPLPVLIVPALLGGAALSTTGGIKLTRILFLFGQVRLELRHSLSRSSVQNFQRAVQSEAFQRVTQAWVFVIIFVVAVGTMQFLLVLLGVGWTDAVRLAIGALCNSGELIRQAQSTTGLTGMSGGVVLVAMIFGRIEILPILVVFTKNFWTR